MDVGESASPDVWPQERQPQAGGYLFLPEACLAATACAFLLLALAAVACFCEFFF
jgi:hypothetical protein